jgi:ribonuclease BN (tRNA processing enzyme)
MKLTVLGCSGSTPGPDSAASGYLVESDGFRLVLDLGSGTFGALQRYVAPTAVDAVIISHLHPDHCLDLTGYYVALSYGPERPSRRIPVIGPAGTRQRLEAAYDPASRQIDMAKQFDFRHPQAGQLGPFEVAYARMNHPVETYAVRLSTAVGVLAYSADTGESDALVTLARGADVLLCEASFGPGEPYVPKLHLSGRQAGEHAARSGVDRLLVTHVPPWGSREVAVSEAATAFDGSVQAAQPDGQYEIG